MCGNNLRVTGLRTRTALMRAWTPRAQQCWRSRQRARMRPKIPTYVQASMGFAGPVTSADPGDLARAEGQGDIVEHGWLWSLPLVVETHELENWLSSHASGGWLRGGGR
jgi:hypothetical protein